MNIIIVGAGTIGSHIAEFLCADGHDVSLIDQAPRNLDEAGEGLDVQTVLGNATDPSILVKAGIADSQLFLAMTNDDSVNLISAMTARRLGAARTVARVRHPWFLDHSSVPYRSALGVDLILSPGRLTAHEIAKRIEQPDVLAFEEFARGRVQMRQIRLDESSAMAGTPLMELDLPPGVLIATVTRGQSTIIPKGESVLEPDDRVAFIGRSEALDKLDAKWHRETADIHTVAIFGGGMVGFYLAGLLTARRYDVRVFERDYDRCDWLTTHLPHTTIIRADATKLGVLKEERVGSVDLMVACTGDDEDNLMSCLLAKSLGVGKTSMVLRRPDYTPIIEQMGIDITLSPRIVTAQRILALVRRGKIRSVALLEGGRVEILEFQALPNTAVVNQPLKEVRFPKGALVGAVVREDEALVPHGTDIIQPGDVAVAFCVTSARDELEALFGENA